MKEKKMYTQEEFDIGLIKKDQTHMSITLNSINERLNSIETKIDSHFHWMLGLTFGLYAMCLSGLISALGHAYGWF